MENSYWQRARITRRRLLATAAIAGGGATSALLIGCGDDDEDAAPGQAGGQPGQPRQGGTLITFHQPDSTRTNQDPHAIYGIVGGYTSATSSMLVSADQADDNPANWKIVPDLAAKWETPDPTTIIFHLDPAAKFHNLPPVNGRPAHAEDVRYSIERIKTTTLPTFSRQSEFKGVTVEVVDAKTARFKFDAPMAAFWTRITTGGTFVLAKEAVDDNGGVINAQKPVAGLGPFIHDVYEKDNSFRVKRNPDYWKPGKPYLDTYQTRYFADDEGRFAAYKAGQIDTHMLSGLDQWNEAKQLRDTNLRSRPSIVPTWVYFQTNKPPFNDPRVRYAISLASPRQEMVRLAYRSDDFGEVSGPGGLSFGLHGSATHTQEDLKKRPGYRGGADAEKDLAEAKKLLEAAGFTGYKGSLFGSLLPPSSTSNTMVEIMRETYQKVGLDLTIAPKTYAEIQGLWASPNWEISQGSQGGNIDPDGYLDIYFSAAGGRNYTKWTHPEFERLLREEQSQLDPKKRNETIRKMVDILEKEAPRMALVVPTQPFALRKKVQGWWTPIGTYALGPVPWDSTWISA